MFVPTVWITNFYSREVLMSSTIDLTALKQRMRDTWMAGDFGVIASYNTKLGEQFVPRINIRPGMKILDVACGTGNVTLPAARAGHRSLASSHGSVLYVSPRAGTVCGVPLTRLRCISGWSV